MSLELMSVFSCPSTEWLNAYNVPRVIITAECQPEKRGVQVREERK